MKRAVVDLAAYRRRKADRVEGFRSFGYSDLREAVTDARRAISRLIPLYLAKPADIAEVADRLEECRNLALAMLEKGRSRRGH